MKKGTSVTLLLLEMQRIHRRDSAPSPELVRERALLERVKRAAFELPPRARSPDQHLC